MQFERRFGFSDECPIDARNGTTDGVYELQVHRRAPIGVRRAQQVFDEKVVYGLGSSAGATRLLVRRASLERENRRGNRSADERRRYGQRCGDEQPVTPNK